MKTHATSSFFMPIRNQNVWFGVGTFGTSDDPMQGLGNCYRMKVRDTNCNDINAGQDLERWSRRSHMDSSRSLNLDRITERSLLSPSIQAMTWPTFSSICKWATEAPELSTTAQVRAGPCFLDPLTRPRGAINTVVATTEMPRVGLRKLST